MATLMALACALIVGPSVAEPLVRLPMGRETPIGTPGDPQAVILVPDEPEYRQIGQALAEAIDRKSGVRLAIESAATYVEDRPRVIRPGTLDRHFILLGQFWNNAVLERLYCKHFDPTDALYPGPGGSQLRTVCSPFVHGQNCIVATGSDAAGTRVAAGRLAQELVVDAKGARFGFLHFVELTGEAAQVEQTRRKALARITDNLDRYATFGHPEGLMLTGEDRRDLLVWKDRVTAMAAVFGARYWATADPRDAEAFKRLVLGCADQLEPLAKLYSEGRSDLVEYSLNALIVAWDLIEETSAFGDEERARITDTLHRLAYLNRDAYFVYKCKDIPLPEVRFWNRHQIAGTTWLGAHGEYVLRNCAPTQQQRALAREWVAHATRYIRRLSESYWYADGVQLLNDEGELVLRYALRTGEMAYVDNGSLRALADYWVANISNTSGLAASGHVASTRQAALGGEVLNAADWLYPGSGYAAFRRRQQRWPCSSFLLYMGGWQGVPVPWWNFERPPSDGWAALSEAATGTTVLPLGRTFYDYIHANPGMWQGGYQRTPGRYTVDALPYERCFKRITLRSGFEPDDAYIVIDGLQGIEWSYDDINAIVLFDALGEHLLKSQWDARTVESRLEMNTLFVSRGRPGAKQSVASEIVHRDDRVLSLRAREHDGVTWTRHIRWEGGPWLLICDEVQAREQSDYYLAQTWLSHHAFEIDGVQATAQAGDVTLHILGTPERALVACEEGVRQTVHASLESGERIRLETLIFAEDADHPRGELSLPTPAAVRPPESARPLTELATRERPKSVLAAGIGLVPFTPDATPTALPIGVDFDGSGERDIAVATHKAITVYRPDGSVRWRRELTNSAAALCAGDLDGDGREELGLSLFNWSMVLDHAGEAVIDEEVYRYSGIGGAFGDVDGDGAGEFVSVTASGVNVLRPGRARQTVGFGSFLGVSPCRVWLADLDGDGALECFIGGGGSDLACYDLKAMRHRWSFADAPIHPRDAALLDIDADGSPEVLGGGEDGFIYVLGADGRFRFSQSLGAAITRLLPVGEDTLAVGLQTGSVVLVAGADLRPVARAEVAQAPIRLLLHTADGLIAEAADARIAVVELPVS